MPRHHSLLSPIALLLLALCHGGRGGRVRAVAPAFVPPGAPGRKATRAAGRRAVVRDPSQTSREGDEDDETFFFRASQLAAQERMALLKEGRRPLAIALSSDAGDADDGGDDEATGAKTDEGGATGTMTSSSDEEDGGSEEEGGRPEPSSPPEVKIPKPPSRPPPSEPEVKIPIDPFLKRREERETIAKSSQNGYSFQRRLLEARLLMEEQTKLSNVGGAELFSAAGGDAETSIENGGDGPKMAVESEEEERGKSIANIGGGAETPAKTAVGIEEEDMDALMESLSASMPSASSAAEEEEPRSESEETVVAAMPDPEAKREEETKTRLSSDGKEIFEPSPESPTTVDPEKVGMGLLALTRSFLALKYIVDKEE